MQKVVSKWMTLGGIYMWDIHSRQIHSNLIIGLNELNRGCVSVNGVNEYDEYSC